MYQFCYFKSMNLYINFYRRLGSEGSGFESLRAHFTFQHKTTDLLIPNQKSLIAKYEAILYIQHQNLLTYL